jgi:GNAT superfamily N-acetyltransferase
MNFRLAGPPDADAIAALHADSWRRHYRGAYSDAFLDGDVGADPRCGALLDNLHVVYERKRSGIGSQLLARTGQTVAERGTGLFRYAWPRPGSARGRCGAQLTAAAANS